MTIHVLVPCTGPMHVLVQRYTEFLTLCNVILDNKPTVCFGGDEEYSNLLYVQLSRDLLQGVRRRQS